MRVAGRAAEAPVQRDRGVQGEDLRREAGAQGVQLAGAVVCEVRAFAGLVLRGQTIRTPSSAAWATRVDL